MIKEARRLVSSFSRKRPACSAVLKAGTWCRGNNVKKAVFRPPFCHFAHK
ncbi:hypothetical protein GC56T3_2805 [Geobacillus sp. C56-T3]|nr:hypothetical protein GC56T3_2805 [Geobacillus sp. C56-T3]